MKMHITGTKLHGNLLGDVSGKLALKYMKNLRMKDLGSSCWKTQ